MKYLIIQQLSTKNYDYCLVLTPTSEDYSDILANDLIITPGLRKNNNIILATILRRQKSHPRRLLLIFDDCVGSLDFKSKEMNQICTRYQHIGSGTTVIIATQYIIQIPQEIRAMCSVGILFRQNGARAYMEAHNSFGQMGGFNNYKEFAEYIQTHALQYTCLVVNMRPTSTSRGDIYSVIRVPNPNTLPQVKFSR